MPEHPGRGVFAVFEASGLALVALAVSQWLWHGHWDAGLVVALVSGGAVNALVGRHLRRTSRGIQLVRAAENQASMGEVDVARELLTRAEEEQGTAHVKREAALARARLALGEGDPEAALQLADRALSIGRGPLSREGFWLLQVQALSIRSFCRAVTGDAPGARADAREIDALLEARPDGLGTSAPSFFAMQGARTLREALARAKLAEAILLAQEGNRHALRELWANHRALFVDGTPPSERALAHGFERLLASPATTAYRKTAEAREASHEHGDWIDRVIPEVAPFVQQAAKSEGGAAIEAASTVAAPPAPFDWGAARRIGATVGVWVALMGGLLGSYAWLDQGRGGPPRTSELELLAAATLVVPLLFVLSLVALTVQRMRVVRRRRAKLFDRLVDAARGREAEAEADLEVLSGSYDALVRGQSHLALADMANDRGDFELAAEHASRGLAPLNRRLMRIVTSEALIPALRSARAVAHAALGHEDDAESELETIGDDYARRAETVFSVKLLVLVRRGALGEGALFAEGRPPGIALTRPLEALVDLLRKTHGEHGLGLSDSARLERALTDDRTRRWLERVAPEAVDALATHADEPTTGVRVAAGAESSRSREEPPRSAEEAEREAEAEAHDETDRDAVRRSAR
jgi:hypothetical protein